MMKVEPVCNTRVMLLYTQVVASVPSNAKEGGGPSISSVLSTVHVYCNFRTNIPSEYNPTEGSNKTATGFHDAGTGFYFHTNMGELQGIVEITS